MASLQGTHFVAYFHFDVSFYCGVGSLCCRAYNSHVYGRPKEYFFVCDNSHVRFSCQCMPAFGSHSRQCQCREHPRVGGVFIMCASQLWLLKCWHSFDSCQLHWNLHLYAVMMKLARFTEIFSLYNLNKILKLYVYVRHEVTVIGLCLVLTL